MTKSLNVLMMAAENGGLDGASITEQVDDMVRVFEDALKLKTNDASGWTKLCKAAVSKRFLWPDSIKEYFDKLYT